MAKTLTEQLLADEEGQRLYYKEGLILEVTEAICRLMKEKDVSRKELAKRTNVSKSNITQLLSGEQNLTLSTVSDLLFALDAKLEVSAKSIAEYAKTINVSSEWTESEDLKSKQNLVKEKKQNEINCAA